MPPDAAYKAPKQEMSKLVQRGRLALASIKSSRWWWIWVRVCWSTTLVHVPGNGKGQARSRVESRPEDFWQASSFGGSFGFFGFLAFGPRWRQEVVAPSTPPSAPPVVVPGKVQGCQTWVRGASPGMKASCRICCSRDSILWTRRPGMS